MRQHRYFQHFNLIFDYNEINMRHLECADALRLSTCLNNNTESRLILRAPLFLKEPLTLATCCVCKTIGETVQSFYDRLAGQLFLSGAINEFF